MKRSVAILLLVALAAFLGGVTWWWLHHNGAQSELVLYGNVDLRQVELPFNNSGRISEVLVEEGDSVHQGDVLARLDSSRLRPAVDQAAAQAAAQREVVARMHAGSRPEEIAQAKANVNAATADAANAKRQFERIKKLATESAGGAVSQQDFDNAKAALEMADARLEVNRKTLELALAGPRKEEIAEAEAKLRGNEAQLKLLEQELADAQLLAPVNAVVRNRVMEPGEMASPAKPVLLLAVTDPKWVRAYVSEPDLGKVKPGEKAWIEVDSFPEHRFDGWVGFISPVAEFTPKPVQTEELRTSLVYEVRVFVNDPQAELRLGMPATVHFDGTSGAATPAESDSSEPAADHTPEKASEP
jgi:HlyD family secretion protein